MEYSFFFTSVEKSIKYNVNNISSDIRIILKNYESTTRGGDNNLEKLVSLYKKLSFKIK